MHTMSTAISYGVADGSRDCGSFILLEEHVEDLEITMQAIDGATHEAEKADAATDRR